MSPCPLCETGSRLFDASVVGEDTRLALNFPVKKFKSEKSNYFRAHPAFLRCLQKTVNWVYQGSRKTIVLADTGFKTADDVSGSTVVDSYSRSGAGAALKFPNGDTTDVKEIARGILVHCPLIFGLEMRDIGVVLMSDKVFVYMTGENDMEPHFESQTSMTSTAFKTWCLTQIDAAIDPVKTPSCNSYIALASGATYPTGATKPEDVVGEMDLAITRESADFKRLVQFAGRNIVFEDSERSSAWCGRSGNLCVDCTAGIKGQASSTRCADRMMSPRLYRSMRVLQKLVREQISGDKLKVIDAWDEPYDGSPTGDHGSKSLFREGRAAVLKLKNTPGKLAKLTQLAICAQMDYVKFDGDKVIVAVKKQADVEPMLVTFPENVLLGVAPPASQAGLYTLPEEIIEDGLSNDYPIFDGAVNTQLGISSKTDDFHSPGTRYFRAHPALVQCYDEIMAFEKRWKSGTDQVKINKAFLTMPQQDDVEAQRGNSHLLGQGLEIAYNSALDTKTYNVHRLAKAAIDQCGPVFYKENWNIGIGVNTDSVFVGMMEEKEFWVDPLALPSGVNHNQYRDSLAERFTSAVHGYVVDPLNPTEACSQVPVEKQNPYFIHKHPKHVVRRRKRGAPDDCVESVNTDFCTDTTKHREIETALIWEEVKRMHLYHDETEVHNALKGCFEKCGNCVKGDIYEEKTKHCNNFLHWAPFSMMNDAADVTNLFYKDNDDMRDKACNNGGHCLDRAPLFAQLAPSLERLYRPDPDKSIEEELYGVMDNPLPVYELLVRMYAMHAKGKVTVWVLNEVEVEYIRSALEVVMLHNKEVTEVEIYVGVGSALMAVDGAVESMIADWVKSGCPKYTRETITPFKVLEMKTDGRKKRSTEEFDLGQQLREKRKYFEQEWIRSTQIN
ncbi:hypothetical protein NP493_35g06091 [Ridgeia piscesae]|uniref:Hedgehog N-terminal signalling domain-containing protein n=1 Tax=Ridgeia piscesae TaxID=27915 RepID=A0AAD9UJY1_RIDPI|nr:hypothetical protein NP493_35g06091 [Ridgeia piscesae]